MMKPNNLKSQIRKRITSTTFLKPTLAWAKLSILLSIIFAVKTSLANTASSSIINCQSAFSVPPSQNASEHLSHQRNTKAELELSELISKRSELINQNASRILIDIINTRIKEKEIEIQSDKDKISALVKKNQQELSVHTEQESKDNAKRIELVKKSTLESEAKTRTWQNTSLQLKTGSRSYYSAPTNSLFFFSDHHPGNPKLMMTSLGAKAQRNQVLIDETGPANHIFITQDQKQAVTAETFWGGVRLYDLQSQKMLSETKLGKDLRKIEFFESMKLLFILNEYRQLEIYDYDGNKKVGFFNKDSHAIEGFFLDREQSQIVIWGRTPGEVSIYSLLTMDLVSQLDLSPEITANIKSITPLKGQDALFFETNRGPAYLINSLNGETLQTFGNENSNFYAGKVSPNEKLVALSSSDSGVSKIAIYSLQGKLLKQFSNNTGIDLHFSPGGRFLVATEAHWRTGIISIFDLDKIKKIKSDSFDDMIFSSVFFNADGSKFYANGSYLVEYKSLPLK